MVVVLSDSTANLGSVHSSWWGYMAAPLFILWSSSSASGIFVSVLRLSEQRFLIAYPLGLLYSCFAILSIFDFGAVGGKKA